MTAPYTVSKSTRFEDRTEVFQYSKDDRDDKDDDWLLSSPIEANPRDAQRANDRKPERLVMPIDLAEEDEIVRIDEHAFEDPEIANLMKQYEVIKKQGSENFKDEREHQLEKEREKEEQRERERQREEENRRAREEQQRWEEEARRQEQLRAQAESQRLREIQEKSRREAAEKERADALQKAVSSQPPPVEDVTKQKEERVTITINDWLKMTQNQQPAVFIQQKPPKVEHHRSSLPGRVTMDLKAISLMFEENFSKNEAISNNNKPRPTISRKSLSYRTTTNNSNSVAFDRYFQSLQSESTEAELAEDKYFAELEEQSGRRLRQSEVKLAKLQEEIRALEAELSSIPDEPEESHFDLARLQSCLDPMKKLYYNFRIQVMQIETNELDPFSVYCEFILDEEIFFKVRREERGKAAEILVLYNSLLDTTGSDTLIDLPSKVEMLKLYFVAHLDRLPTYQMLEQLGAYYGQLKELDDDLARCCSIFNIRSMELSRNYEKLTFELLMHPKTTVLVTLKLITLMEPNYYEFYHIEASREVLISEEALRGDDLIDILEAVSEAL